MFELYQRDYHTGQRGKTGHTPTSAHRALCVPLLTQRRSGVRFAGWAATVVPMPKRIRGLRRVTAAAPGVTVSAMRSLA
jgi:hypothetical protein